MTDPFTATLGFLLSLLMAGLTAAVYMARPSAGTLALMGFTALCALSVAWFLATGIPLVGARGGAA